MEYLEKIRALPLNSFASPKGIGPPCLGRVVFPDLLFRVKRIIILFEGEITPYYRNYLTNLPFYVLQPDRRAIDERSEVIEIDFEFRQFYFPGLWHVVFL